MLIFCVSLQQVNNIFRGTYMSKAPFIVFEGIDGCGKTSVIAAIKRRYPFLFCTREPGGTFVAEQIRSLLLSPKGALLSPQEQMTLFFAARQIHLHEVIESKRQEGVPVVSDRFDGSTFAFQKCVERDGSGNHELIEFFMSLRNNVVAGKEPSLYIYLQVDPGVGARRRSTASGQDANHFDNAQLEEQERRSVAYDAFLGMVRLSGVSRVEVVDANQPLDQVIQECLFLIAKELGTAA